MATAARTRVFQSCYICTPFWQSPPHTSDTVKHITFQTCGYESLNAVSSYKDHCNTLMSTSSIRHMYHMKSDLLSIRMVRGSTG
jgi:hypothetical protein